MCVSGDKRRDCDVGKPLRLTPSAVIAGHDPAIHPFNVSLFPMDARVKPAHDESRTTAADN